MPHFQTVKAVLMVSAIIGLAVVGAMAQSGRNIPKKPQTTTAPTPEPKPTAKPLPTPLYNVRVISDIQQDAFLAFPKPEYMYIWAIERLKKSPVLNVIDGGFENRRDAINKAKEETGAYVVLLQLEPRPGVVPATGPGAGVVRIAISVFSPGTGKAKFTKWDAFK